MKIYIGKFVHPEATNKTKYIRRFLKFPGPSSKMTWCTKCGILMLAEMSEIVLEFDVDCNRPDEVKRIREMFISGFDPKDQNSFLNRIWFYLLEIIPIYRVKPKPGYLCFDCAKYQVNG